MTSNRLNPMSKLASERMSSLPRGCNHVHMHLISLCTHSSTRILDRHECFTGKYTTRKIHTKLHPGPKWRIFHISSLVRILMTSFPAFRGCLSKQSVKNGEQEICLYKNIVFITPKKKKFISSRRRVISSI